MRAVIDTGMLVSAMVRRQGVPGEVIAALRDGRFTAIYSTAILVEVVEVLARAPFREKYHVQHEDIVALIDLIRLRGELVVPKRSIKACRDPKDDRFLEAAVAGEAKVIVSGGADLLELNPFEDIQIVRPAEFLASL